MSMKISTRQVDGVTVVDCSGRITLGEGSVTLRDTVSQSAYQEPEENSAQPGRRQLHRQLGIGELVSAFTTVRNQAVTSNCST